VVFGGERTGGGRGALTCLDGQPVICSTGLALLLDGLAGRPSATAVIVWGNEESSMQIRLPGPAPGSAEPPGPGERRRIHPGADRVPAGMGEADPGDEPVPGPHRLLDQPGIHVDQPELGTAEQPQRSVAWDIPPGQAEAAVVAGAPDERP